MFQIEVDDRSVKSLLRLPKRILPRVRKAISALAFEPRPPGSKKLTGREGYRIRVGDYRVLYEIEDEKKRIRIYKISHRKDAVSDVNESERNAVWESFDFNPPTMKVTVVDGRNPRPTTKKRDLITTLTPTRTQRSAYGFPFLFSCLPISWSAFGIRAT